MAEKTLKERTATGLLWGAVNNLSTQVFMALIGIFLARLLLPADYGMVGMLAIFSAIASSLQESGFISAITNLKQATHRDYNAVFWFSTIVSVSLYSLLFLSAPLIANFFHQPELIPLSRLVFASFVVAGIGTAHAAYMFRNMMNREKAIMNMIAMIVSGTLGILLAYYGFSYWSLAWQQFVYICIVNICRLYYVRWLPSLHIDLTPIREMFGFSSRLLITNIINQLNNNILSFIFGRLFTPGALGNYTQAAKWNSIGYYFVSGTIQQVAQPVLASVKEEDDRQLKVFRKLLRFTAFLSMPTMLGLAFVAEEFITILIGDKWLDSVPLLRILCISGAFMPIHTLYQNLFISNGKSSTYMWCSMTQVVLQLAIIVIFSSFGIITMVAAYTTMLVFWTYVWQLLAKRFIGISFSDMLKDVCPFALAAVGCIGIAYFLTLHICNIYLLIFTRIIITSLLYAVTMKVVNVKIFNECQDYFLGRIRTLIR